LTQKLIEFALSGDEAALERLFYQHYPPTLRLARGLLGDEQDAEEVAQDALTYVLTRLEHYDPQRAAFATWLYTVTVSRCRSKRRRRRLPTFRFVAWIEGRAGGEPRDPRPGPEESYERHEQDAALWRAVAELSPKQREAIALRYALGLTYPQMAQVLKCSASAAQSRTWLGEQRLRELLSDLVHEAVSNANSRNKHQ
jgi:RNA polymerase sigma-70 factor (ECF subfamily)